ncbi:MAG: hypothetical protein PHU21_05180 [Elusimicrobia bacterium]|nr:hypothetical protein [Elusimicrobiota bacterium]
MRSGLAAVLLLAASAVRGGETGLPGLLREPPEVAAQAAVKALPAEAQIELFTLYARYNETVTQRGEEGWRAGLLSDEGTKVSQDDTLPARQLEESLRNREAEVRTLAQRLEKPENENEARLRRQYENAWKRAAALRSALARAKGTCLDWSDLVWAELGRLQPEYWSIQDRERAARPFHAAAVLCSPPADDEEAFCSDADPEGCAAGRRVCLAFDPWQRGQADVYELGAWNKGLFAGRVPADFFLHDLPEPKPVRTRRPKR